MSTVLGVDKIRNNSAGNWIRPEDLSDAQSAILDSFNFPKEVRHPNVLQVRMRQIKNGVFYLPPGPSEFKGHITYSQLSFNAAFLVKPHPNKDKLTSEEYKAALVAQEKAHQTREVVDFFVGREYIQESMEHLLKNVTPPTVSKAVEMREETPKLPKETLNAESKPSTEEEKGLSNIHKSRIKELTALSHDAQEIAEEIEKPVEMVIAYISKCNK
ncbi:MAG: hypothetical protein ACRBFS_19470 [Aureispira sp.]